jgi:hypothetical protein
MGKEVYETPSQLKRLGLVACPCHLSYGRKSKVEEGGSYWPGKKKYTISKISRGNRAGVVPQVPEILSLEVQSPEF